MALAGTLLFNSESPVFFEQHMNAGDDFNGAVPSNLMTDGVQMYGGISIPFDATGNGGLFPFTPRRPLRILSIEHDLDTGAVASVSILRADASEFLVSSGVTGKGIEHIESVSQPYTLSYGDSVKVVSVGASGVQISRLRIYVKSVS